MHIKSKQVLTVLLFTSLIALFVGYKSGILEQEEVSLMEWAQQEDFPIFNVKDEPDQSDAQIKGTINLAVDTLNTSNFDLEHIYSTKYFIPFSHFDLQAELSPSPTDMAPIDTPLYNWKRSPAHQAQQHELPQ